MIGSLRLALSLLIMLAHLGPYLLTGHLPPVAVLGFYVLAGYTATASVDGPYRGRPLAFMGSRLVRLWPSYLMVFALSLLWIQWVGSWQAIGLLSAWRVIPEAFMMISAGVVAIVPTGWVLPWFILIYGAIAAGVVATPRRVGVVLICVVLAAEWLSFEAAFASYYYSPLYAALGGATGAAMYHLGVVLPRDGRWGARAGALSYPVFLAHYLVGAMVSSRYGLIPGWPLFFTALAPTLALSWLLVIAVERPVAKFRSPLRNTMPPTP